MMDRATTDALRRKLLDRQRALFDDVDDLDDDLRAVEDDREPELEGRAQGEAMMRLLDRVRERDRHELEEIYRALAKIPAGAYGACERCRAPIAVERLQVTPEARYCVDCQQRLEASPEPPSRAFEPRWRRGIPSDYRDLDDEELAEAVRERLGAEEDPDLLGIGVRCHGGVVRLSGEIPSEQQRRIVVRIIADGMGLEVLDRLRVAPLERERDGEARPPVEEAPAEERIPARRGMWPLEPERSAVPDDEGEPPADAPDSPPPEPEER